MAPHPDRQPGVRARIEEGALNMLKRLPKEGRIAIAYFLDTTLPFLPDFKRKNLNNFVTAAILGLNLMLPSCTPQSSSESSPQPSPIVQPIPLELIPSVDPTRIPEPTLQPTPTIEGPTIPGETLSIEASTIPGETLSIGGANLNLQTIPGKKIARMIDVEKEGWQIVVDKEGNSSFFTGYAGPKGKEVQVAVLAQGPERSQWDEKNQVWKIGEGEDEVMIPDVLLPGGWNEEKGLAGPAHEAERVFLFKDKEGNYRAGVIYSADVVAQISDKSNLQILSDGRGLYVSNPKNFNLQPGQTITRDGGNLRLTNPDGSYQLMRTSWSNVHTREQLYQAGVFAGPIETLPEVPYPKETMTQEAIILFADVFGLNPEEVKAGITYKPSKDKGGKPFVIATYHIPGKGDYSLLIAEQGEDGEWRWKKATPGNYWRAIGKFMGLYMNGDELRPAQNKELVTQHFAGGILSLNGQVRPGPDIDERKPSNASSAMQLAKKGEMAVNFHYIAEPGKYPPSVTKDNVDMWMVSRLSGTADLIKANRTGNPTLIEYNEAWSTKKAAVNEERDPLKEQHGDRWAEEYIYTTLSVFIEKGLIPNIDFIIMFNENRMYNNPEKQRLIHHTLVLARANAFNRLASNPTTADLLNKMGIKKADDIMVLLGAETHTKIGQQIDDGTFIPDPTPEQIRLLAALFGDLGGIIMTEVNPQGNTAQKNDFIKRITSLLKIDPNLRGIILWNVFNDPGDSTDKTGLMASRVELFNPDGSPTELYYALLQY